MTNASPANMKASMSAKRTLLFIFLNITCMTTQSALVERDWFEAGDAGITYDTASGLEWLDLTYTAGLSYSDITQQLAGGTQYEGFRIATEQEITSLFAAADLAELPLTKSEDGPRIAKLLEFWGVLWDWGTGERSEFLTNNTTNLPSGQHWSGRLVWTEQNDTGVTAMIRGLDDQYNNATIGVALVRPALTQPVTGDINADGVSDLADLSIVVRIVLGYPTGPGIDPGYADYYPPGNPDGIIDVSDLILMLKNSL